jgi:hypothetical protein
MAKGRPVEKIIEPIPISLKDMGKALLQSKSIRRDESLNSKLERQTNLLKELEKDVEKAIQSLNKFI